MSIEREASSTMEGHEAPAHGTDSASAPPDMTGAGNVDKIRDILFGSQMRDYEMRFKRLEETLMKEAGDVRETTRRRLDSLEAYLKREFESLQGRLKSERDERSDGLRRLTQELTTSVDSISRKIADIEDQNASAHGDLRQDILQCSNDLRDEMRAMHNEISSVLERRFQELRAGKTDRAALASLFTEVAMKLTDEFQLPEG